jgi:hypothetical protein
MTDVQTKWRFCAKCAVLFYNGYGTRGSCPADGDEHAPAGWNFQPPCNGPETDHAQRNWQFCGKCFAMHWTLAKNQPCNIGGSHAPNGVNFSLPHTVPETGDAESNWRFCAKCANLFWERAAEDHCTAGGTHGAAGNVFTIPHRADHVYDSGPITSPLPLGGWAQLTVRPDGGWTFSTHAKDSGADNIHYVLGAVLVNRYGQPFAFSHSGHVNGWLGGLPAGETFDNQTTSGVDPRLRDQYDNLADADLSCSLNGVDTLAAGIHSWLSGLADEALSQIGQAAEAAIIEAAA